MTSLFIQVRLDSSRLPRKALLPLNGKTVVENALDSLKKIRADHFCLLTTEDSAEILAPLASRSGFDLFIGSKNDVLGRFAKAIQFYKPETIIRATGDNPLVSWELGNQILDLHRRVRADYSGFLSIPVGSGVEIVQAEALLTADSITQDMYDREHVTPYLYGHPQEFCINQIEPEPEYRSSLRITLDTMDDYHYLQSLYRNLSSAGVPTFQEIISAASVIPRMVQANE